MRPQTTNPNSNHQLYSNRNYPDGKKGQSILYPPSANNIIAPDPRNNFRVSGGTGNTPGHPLFNVSAVSEIKTDTLRVHSISKDPPPNVRKRESILKNKNNLKLDITYSAVHYTHLTLPTKSKL